MVQNNYHQSATSQLQNLQQVKVIYIFLTINRCIFQIKDLNYVIQLSVFKRTERGHLYHKVIKFHKSGREQVGATKPGGSPFRFYNKVCSESLSMHEVIFTKLELVTNTNITI